MSGSAARHLGKLGKCGFNRGERLSRVAAGAVDQPGCEPFGIVELHLEEVLGSELLVAFAQRERLRGLNKTAGAVGVFFKVHGISSAWSPARLPAREEHRQRNLTPPALMSVKAERCGFRTAIRDAYVGSDCPSGKRVFRIPVSVPA